MTDWILSSSVLIAAVIALRAVFKGRISMRLRYGLWALVLIRLLIPGNFIPSDFSIQKLTLAVERQPQVQQITQELNTPKQSYESVYQEVVKEHFEVYYPGTTSAPDTLPDTLTATLPAREQAEIRQEAELRVEQSAPIYSLKQILLGIWILGMAVIGSCLLVINWDFSRRLKRTRQRVEADTPVPVYKSFMAETPCLFGLFRPVIYITEETTADSKALSHILAHESSHYWHKDHIWAFLRCVCLVLHWYNPLVWAAVSLSRRDCELACDEATIGRIGEENRIEYGRTLVDMTCIKRAPSAVLLTATTMLSDKKTLTRRIQQVARKPKVVIGAVVTAVIIAAVTVGCTFTGAPKETTAPTEPAETTAPTQPPETTVPPQTTAPTQPTETTEPPRVDEIAEMTNGTVHSYPLEITNGNRIHFMGDDILVISTAPNPKLTLLSGEDLTVKAQVEVSSTVLHYALNDSQLVYYCYDTNACIIMDANLQVIKRVNLPDLKLKEVLLSHDLTTVYYPHEGSIVAKDLNTEKTRQLLQSDGQFLRPKALAFDDSVLMCYYESVANQEITGNTVFVSTADGKVLGSDASLMNISTWGENYLISRITDTSSEEIIGDLSGTLYAFTRKNRYSSLDVLPQMAGIVESDNASANTMVLSLYDAASGMRTASMTINCNSPQRALRFTPSPDGKYIWFIAENTQTYGNTLYRWDYTATPSGDNTVYVGPRYTPENPDLEGLAACEARIRTLEDTYNLDIQINKEPRLPSEYGYVAQSDVPAIAESLDELEKALAQYPAGLINKLGSLSRSGKLHIALVAKIETNSELYLMSWNYYLNGNATMALQCGPVVDQLFYRELGIYMDEYICQNSSILDNWSELNSEGFTYFNDYERAVYESGTVWPDNFADGVGMASEAYDRATVMEYAMLETAGGGFSSDRMQAKLRLWCQAIREVFDLENVNTPFLWEQHLKEPLT